MLSHLGYSPIVSYTQDVAKRAANARSFIWYNMDGFTKSTDGAISLINKGSAGSRLNAEAFASNHIYLNGTTQSVPYPVLHTLGSEVPSSSITVSWGTATGTFSSTADTFNLAVTIVGTEDYRPTLNIIGQTLTDGTQVVKFDCTINSGSPKAGGYYNGSSWIVFDTPIDIVNGSNQIEIYRETTSGTIALGFYGKELFDISAINAKTAQLTLPTASYFTRFSSSSSTITELSSTGDRGDVLPVSATYSVTDSHQFAFNHTAPLEDIDVSAIEADPNLAFRMFFDGEVLPSGFSSTDVGWFSGGNEGLASAEKVYDLSDQTFLTYVSIVDYDAATRTTLANQSNGASNLKLTRNVSGGTTGTAAANTTQWEADGRTAVTNWTITAPYTITEIIGIDTYTFTSDLNRYKNSIADGTFIAPTGIWTLDEFGFDGVISVTARGVTRMIYEVVIP